MIGLTLDIHWKGTPTNRVMNSYVSSYEYVRSTPYNSGPESVS